jgi:hypothetical protein
VIAADETGVTVAMFGSETALPWLRISDPDLLQIAATSVLRADAGGMAAWLHLALYVGWQPEHPQVVRVAGELLRADRPRFDDYAALVVRLRQ